MVSIKNLLFLITAASALVIEKRDAAGIQADLNTINTDTNNLKAAADRFTGGLFGALPVQQAADKLEDDLNTATDNANASAAVSDSEAASIIRYINNTLEPNVDAALTSIENKKQQFTSAGLKGKVQDTLTTLRKDTNEYGTALLAKAPASAQDSGKAALAKIDGDFAATQAFYAN
ncbi:Putative Cell wall mannoprotein [Septoria linicola]|uniref:Cell wall mannoprotein n=1 Tax=Septoria linicola TaxID=215465 RepID=A0A9Q9AUQ2_9PEZI|nr:putative Cell wall mannoprotein [Septoria linicola]USW55744.1 Putative Cell wall mannoprotein [Septoria linicola]